MNLGGLRGNEALALGVGETVDLLEEILEAHKHEHCHGSHPLATECAIM